MKLFQSKVTCMYGQQIHTSGASGMPSLEYPNGGGYCYHDFIEIELFCEGGGIHHLNSIPYQVQRGYFYLLMPGDYHYYSLDESVHFRLYNIKLDAALPAPAILSALTDLPKPYAVYLEGSAFETVLREVECLHGAVREYGDGNLYTRNIAERIIILLIQQMQVGLHRAEEHLPASIRAIVDYVNQHYRESITSDDMGVLTGLTPHYFSSYFKKQTGIVFCDYVNRVRLFHAKDLLDTTALSMKEIAHAVGFESQGYFTRMFTKQFGIPPTQYRKEKLLQ